MSPPETATFEMVAVLEDVDATMCPYCSNKTCRILHDVIAACSDEPDKFVR